MGEFCPENASWLTEPVVDVIDHCAFRWPKTRQNFARDFPAVTRQDCDRLADFVCGLHYELWGHTESESLSVGVIGEESSEIPQGCRLGDCRWFSVAGAAVRDETDPAL